MKKIFLLSGLLLGTVILSGCNDDGKQFIGNWKAVSTSEGKPLLKWMDERITITCKDNTCHVVSKVLNSGSWFTQESDWKIDNASTISMLNGIGTMHVDNGKIRSSNRVYEKQTE
ncbi:hypothetical protein [Photorhabdus temperata]|uniref:Lipoprotein n=1 Tax=Photorhabdus temperata J3 TaxID=1389415 RepID=U7QWJ8_PHOTE|nr:hypothetical protein [Photorhabdus temperata]EQB98958.1 hypothetical protein B738_21143 [Photorhabdus temperata subsp. temperata M1021]ERT10856.1 hypothetical protein O185_22590 [Photorhabdus temperata J3]